jgi:hypothetical protein
MSAPARKPRPATSRRQQRAIERLLTAVDRTIRAADDVRHARQELAECHGIHLSFDRVSAKEGSNA